jgi:N-acetylglucosaminyldiphosphoundecaprenol N-acetyl-beta-D-mannosaminyltransferase
VDAETARTETNSVIERLNVLTVPIDILPPEQLEAQILDMAKANERQNMVLLSLWDLLRARRSGDYRNYVTNAKLVVPISNSLVDGSHFLTKKIPYRYMPFDFIIAVLTALEKRGYSIYLLGGKRSTLKKAEKNIRQTFPKLQIVGRYIGKFKTQDEPIILEAIRKASPTLLLVGSGIRGREKWLAKKQNILNLGMRLWCSDILEVFAEQRSRPSRAVFSRGLEWIGFCFRNPLRIFKFFSYVRYIILLVFYRLFRKAT